jgi:hypothetical protein
MHQVRRPYLASRDGMANPSEVRIESPVKSDLQFDSGLLDSGKSAVDPRWASRRKCVCPPWRL